ncbi:MAG: AMP-binding protein [Candidatus Zixiibacteriota bacterium]
MLIHELLNKAAELHADRTAFWLRSSDGFKPLTYAAMWRRVSAIAAGLPRLGHQPGGRIGIYAANSPEWCMIYLAILAAGGVAVPLDPQLKYLEIRTIIARADMRHIFCAHSSYADLVELSSMSMPHPDVISIDPPPQSNAALTLSQLEGLGFGKNPPPSPAKPNDLAILIFTSGTSGDSKGVMLSHENITSDLEAIKPRLIITHDDRFLSVLPLHHTFESTCGFIFPLSIGASIGYVQSLKSADLLADVKALRATVMCGVPLLYEKIHWGILRALQKKSPIARLYVNLGRKLSDFSKSVLNIAAGKLIFKSLRAKAGLSSIRMFISGGAALDPEVSRFFNNLGIVLLQGYGLTETSPVLSVNREIDNDYNSVGKPLDGVDIKILDINEQGIGEIAARGKMIMLGYYQNPEATQAVMHDGYFATGDLGYVDAKGHIHITGRKKNVIITPAGKNIYPEEIEAVIDASPYIIESAVLPRPKGTGQEPIAVVVPDFEYIASLNANHVPTDEEIRRILKSEVLRLCEQLAEYKRVKDVLVMTEELPKTSTRKVKRYVLVDTLQKLGEL